MVALGGVGVGGMHGCSVGACVVAPGGVCVVAPGGVCVVALGGRAWFSRGHAWILGGACVVFSMRYGQ